MRSGAECVVAVALAPEIDVRWIGVLLRVAARHGQGGDDRIPLSQRHPFELRVTSDDAREIDERVATKQLLNRLVNGNLANGDGAAGGGGAGKMAERERTRGRRRCRAGR